MNYRILLLCLFSTAIIYSQVPQPDHVVIVIEENHGYNQIIGNSNAPYINSLANDTLGALFTDYHALTHPSQPNYLLFFSGDNQGVTDDNIPTDTPFTTPNLGAELLQSNLTFGGYCEDLPYTGYQGGTVGSYHRTHNPWVNWQGNNANGIPASLNMPLTDLPTDYNAFPNISFVIPNEDDDMHNGTIAQGDTWLQNNLGGYIQWTKTNNSLFILIFDEDEGSENNRVVCLIVGQMVNQGQYAQNVTHLNLLRTIEDMYGLSYAGSSADSSDITNWWMVSTPVELTSFTSNFNGNNVTLNWTTSSETNNKGFEIERSSSNSNNQNSQWENIGFIDGHGTTTKQHNYSFTDNAQSFSPGIYKYRLKQLDLGGSFKYSKTVEVTINQPTTFNLSQNYPNPFNPTTVIRYTIPSSAVNGSEGLKVTLKVFDILGNEAATLVNEAEQAGAHQVVFNANKLASGIYFYRLNAGNFVQTRKMVLLH